MVETSHPVKQELAFQRLHCPVSSHGAAVISEERRSDASQGKHF
jgi:hypothetical protein